MTINSKITTTLTMEEVVHVTSALLDRARAYEAISAMDKFNNRRGESMGESLAKQYTHLANRLSSELYDYKSDNPEDHCGS